MGMFDWIEFKIPCPNCGTEVKDFQSKDGNCELQRLTVKELVQQSYGNAKFYTNCPNIKCNMWIEFCAYDDGIRIESARFKLNNYVKHVSEESK